MPEERILKYTTISWYSLTPTPHQLHMNFTRTNKKKKNRRRRRHGLTTTKPEGIFQPRYSCRHLKLLPYHNGSHQTWKLHVNWGLDWIMEEKKGRVERGSWETRKESLELDASLSYATKRPCSRVIFSPLPHYRLLPSCPCPTATPPSTVLTSPAPPRPAGQPV
jgi:hypothetical protein